ncbi:phage/plasmid replication protein, II/X family [Psychrobacter sp. T6-1]|uniref:phage/plasmid replication protein, II/X family n=1 Tax=Psychrobacter sp. T6-1 TaxID=3457447 RepID=UPI003FD01F60
MLDHLKLAIPVLPLFIKHFGDTQIFNSDIRDYGLPAATRHVSRDENGNTITGDLYAPYESLPSSYTDMAMKFYTQSRYCPPYVELKASPLKLLQGHNVFGFESIELGAVEMLGLLRESYPDLYQILDIAKIEVLHLDTTYFSRLPSQTDVQPVLNYLANCSAGHRKANTAAYDNYVTWGSNNSRYLRPKAYGKFEEMKSQLRTLQKRADKGCVRSKNLVTKMLEVLPFANSVVRFEGRVCKTYLAKNGYPTNLWELIKEQRKRDSRANCPTLLKHLWNKVFDPIFNTLKGENMQFSDNSEILLKLKKTHWKQNVPKEYKAYQGSVQPFTNFSKDNRFDLFYTPYLFNFSKLDFLILGKISYVKANNTFQFYNIVRQMGIKKVKADKLYSKPTFYRHMKALDDAGYSKASVENAHENPEDVAVTVYQFVNLGFLQQLPDNYKIPTSRHLDALYAA